MAEQKTKVDNLGEAISVLVQAVNIAQAKGGVYSFADAAKINSALEFITAASKQNAPKTPGPEGPVDVATTKENVFTEEVDASVEK